MNSSTIVFLWSLTTVHPLPRQAAAHRLWNLLGHLEIHHAEEKARQLRLRGDSCRGGNGCQIGRSWVGSQGGDPGKAKPGQVVAGCHGSPNPRATISHEKRRARALPGHPGSYLRGAAVAELVGNGLDAPGPRHRDVAAL